VWRHKQRKAAELGFYTMRISGDGGWLKDGDWLNAYIYELEIDRLVNFERLHAICTYPMAKLQLQKITNIGKLHQSSLFKKKGHWSTMGPREFERSANMLVK